MLKLNRSIYESLRRHGEETYPYECCGALVGRFNGNGREVVEAIRTDNTRIDSARNRYQISPQELIRIQRKAREQELEIVGFYHSHPDHPAQWSKTDFLEAHWLGCSYVITSVTEGRAGQTNSFLLSGATEEEKQFEDEKIEIAES
jgi:proteasome lid subunit RPN8/RPN11